MIKKKSKIPVKVQLIAAIIAVITVLFVLFRLHFITKIQAWFSNVKRNNSNVPGNGGTNPGGGANVNVYDIAKQMHDKMTYFGVIAYGGSWWVSGADVVKIVQTVPKMYIKQLADSYAQQFQRNMYSDLVGVLDSEEYNSIKYLIV